MQLDDHARRAPPIGGAIAEGQRVLTVCNACRYCEQFCPVFPAVERRRTFAEADLAYLANLCHNCGECLYACQYAPPHEFGINVPKTLAEIRVHSYEEYAWPRAFGAAFRYNSLLTGLGLAAGLTAVMFASTIIMNAAAIWRGDASGDFYVVVPHGVMVALFGGVSLLVVSALWIGCARFWRDMYVASGFSRTNAKAGWGAAMWDALTLRHLHGGGVDCPSEPETRSPWRRWFHHCTFYGFMLCFASTSVAAVYHSGFGWHAPYAYSSLPVLLGTIGGLGLLVGPVGLAVLRRSQDSALGDPAQRGMDQSFLVLLFLTSLTGLMLLALRHQQMMGALLIVHMGCVLALFLTFPYGKFVHGLYRTVALARHHREAEVN